MLSLPLPLLAAEDDEHQIEKLAASGLPAYALHRLEQAQPEYYQNFEAWMRWERLRIGIHKRHGNWATVLERLRNLPRGLPTDFRLWAASQQVDSFIQLGRSEDAEALLATLVWNRGAIPIDESLSGYRRQIIVLHLASGRIEDALGASRRYRQDYTDNSPAWRLLHARVLLSSGQAAAALGRLADTKGRVAEALRLISGISGEEPVDTAYERAAKLAPQLQPQLRRWFWSALVAVAGERRVTRLHLRSLEAMTALLPWAKEQNRMLLSAYVGYAEELAAKAGLSATDVNPLMQYAAEQVSRDPLAARALYAHLSRRATAPELRDQAQQNWGELLAGIHAGALLRHIYPVGEALPVAIYPVLVDTLLTAGDLEAVAEIFTDWKRPAVGLALHPWQLAWARFSLHAGKVDGGLALLTLLLEQAQAPELSDHLVGEALSFAEQAPEAGRAFVRALLVRRGQSEITPELWFRIGVFFVASGDDAAAVTAFLPIVAQGSGVAGIRLVKRHLAAALGRMGVWADAERIYRGLLRVEDDPLLRVQLEQALFDLQAGALAKDGLILQNTGRVGAIK